LNFYGQRRLCFRVLKHSFRTGTTLLWRLMTAFHFPNRSSFLLSPYSPVELADFKRFSAHQLSKRFHHSRPEAGFANLASFTPLHRMLLVFSLLKTLKNNFQRDSVSFFGLLKPSNFTATVGNRTIRNNSYYCRFSLVASQKLTESL
jgi:hypothetical protein